MAHEGDNCSDWEPLASKPHRSGNLILGGLHRGRSWVVLADSNAVCMAIMVRVESKPGEERNLTIMGFCESDCRLIRWLPAYAIVAMRHHDNAKRER